VTRRFRRILHLRRAATLALAVTAVAAPAAVADTPVGQDQLSITSHSPRQVVVDRASPDARDAGRRAPVSFVSPDARDAGRRAPVSFVSPDARDAGRSVTPPAASSAPTAAATDHFDWLDAGIGAAGIAALLLLGGTAAVVRTRRGPIGAA
jgi:hypothetical protein